MVSKRFAKLGLAAIVPLALTIVWPRAQSANRIMLNVGYMREAHPWVRTMDDDMRKLRVPAAKPYEHDRLLMQSSLSCENVSFGYEGGPPFALDGVSFTIERGQSVGIVGPTGAGKKIGRAHV